jgi:ABC-2 type transport system ATP-binding protein
LEADLERGQTLNQLFDVLRDHGIEIVSMRNKANRLEELFLRLIAENKTEL